MIYGIGTDIIEIDRFSHYSKDSSFLKKYFSEEELKFAFRYKNWHERIAGFFAAKEAFLKAWGIGITKGISLKDIKILHKENGAPYILIAGKTQKTIQNIIKDFKIHLSISHNKKNAIAFVIIEKVK